jgi:hypothetical protein
LLCADNVLRTAAGEFLWRVVNPKAPPGAEKTWSWW